MTTAVFSFEHASSSSETKKNCCFKSSRGKECLRWRKRRPIGPDTVDSRGKKGSKRRKDDHGNFQKFMEQYQIELSVRTQKDLVLDFTFDSTTQPALPRRKLSFPAL